mmetsp:Transcript_44300/g.89451  ORF Transcript_44300/g.89451 Transcript_44300/m.89451 type:complete len:130 (+) Transcript_44300:1109-1498(+)
MAKRMVPKSRTPSPTQQQTPVKHLPRHRQQHLSNQMRLMQPFCTQGHVEKNLREESEQRDNSKKCDQIKYKENPLVSHQHQEQQQQQQQRRPKGLVSAARIAATANLGSSFVTVNLATVGNPTWSSFIF